MWMRRTAARQDYAIPALSAQARRGNRPTYRGAGHARADLAELSKAVAARVGRGPWPTADRDAAPAGFAGPPADRARAPPAATVGRAGRRSSAGHAALGAVDASVSAPVGHGEQPADPAGDRVLGERRVGERAELLQRGLLVLQPQPAGRGQVLGRLLAEDLQRAADPGAGGDRGARADGAGSRRRSWRAGSRWRGPRGASGAPPRPAPTRARRAGSAARRSRRRRGSRPGPSRAPRGAWRRRCRAGGPRRPARSPTPCSGR